MIRLVPVNQPEYDAVFERMERAIDTMGDVVVHESVAFAIQTVSDIFEGEGTHPGLGTKAWDPLSAEQRSLREKELGPGRAEHPILQYYGNLYFSLTESDHPHAAQEITRLRAGDYLGLYGTSDPKFEMHQTGKGRPERIIWPEADAEQRLMDMMEYYLLYKVRKLDGV